MFKRLFWLMVGAGFGFRLSFWVTGFVRETVERYAPERVSSDLSNALPRVRGRRPRGGGRGPRRHAPSAEAELRAELDAGSSSPPASRNRTRAWTEAR